MNAPALYPFARRKRVPVVPCMCGRCHAAVLALPDGERRWEQRAELALRTRRVLRDQLRASLADECDMAERRRARAVGGVA